MVGRRQLSSVFLATRAYVCATVRYYVLGVSIMESCAVLWYCCCACQYALFTHHVYLLQGLGVRYDIFHTHPHD